MGTAGPTRVRLNGVAVIEQPTAARPVAIVRGRPTGPPGSRERLQARLPEVSGDEGARVAGGPPVQANKAAGRGRGAAQP